MLDRFRVRYPTACLTAELITIHDGLFVVKASIHQDGTLLATGMSAALTVEQAEDRARLRAIEVLGLADEALPSLSPSVPDRETPTVVSSVSPPPSVSPPISPVRPELEPVSALSDRPESPESLANSTESDPVKPLPRPSTPPASAPISSPPLSSSPTDDSDLMMKTTLEINRLEWTAQQGRSYLENTYQKRSRQQLTREELLDFLQYLESQPTPTLISNP